MTSQLGDRFTFGKDMDAHAIFCFAQFQGVCLV